MQPCQLPLCRRHPEPYAPPQPVDGRHLPANSGRFCGQGRARIRDFQKQIDQKTAERLNAYCESVHTLKSEAFREALDMLLTEKYERKKNYE